MSVPREVILDLLPLYAAGEASPASRALVEEYLRGDPELAARARALAAPERGVPEGPLVPELELRSIRRTRRMIAAQRWLLGFGIGFTALALAMEMRIEHGRIVEFHFLLRDLPVPLGLFFVAGLGLLAGYVVLTRRLRYTER